MLARDLMDRLAAMPRLVQACTERLPRSEWTRQPSPGLFSMVEHCCHLRDLEEEGYTLRLRRMLRENAPVLADFDGGKVAAGRSYPAQDLTQAMQAFAEARSRNLLVFAGLDRTALARTAQFGEQGTIETHPLKQISLLVVMRDQRNAFASLHDYSAALVIYSLAHHTEFDLNRRLTFYYDDHS